MDQANQVKSKPTLLYILTGILSLAVFAGVVFWQYQKPERKSGANGESQNQNAPSTSRPSGNADTTSTQPVSQAENLYLQGSKELTSKNYSEAIKYFDQAITSDPYEPLYYSDKSGVQYNLGDKQGAIDTLKQGSSLNPDSDLLKSKLDVLTKDQFSDPNAPATRE